MSILATTDTAVAPQGVRPRLRVVRASDGPVTIAWFEDLVAQHGAWLRHVVRRRMANPALVDDALQETLLRVCRSSPPAEARDLRRWLAGVAKHTCADVWRAQDLRAVSLDRVDEAVASWQVTVPGSDEHLAAVARRAQIYDALLRLPPRHRRLLEKQVLLGLSYEEIADEENVSIACVTSALGRARAGFRRRYADGEARAMPAWAAVLSGVACRLRARMARTQAALVGRAAELAAASFTLGMAAVLVAVPASSSRSSTGVADVVSSSPAASAAERHASSPPASTATPARVSRPEATAPSATTPPRRAVGEIATAPPDIALTPVEWRVSFKVEVGAPHDTAHVRVEVTLGCEGSRVMDVACPVAARAPGAQSSS